MKITGHQQAGQEIQIFLLQWDQAVCSLDIHAITQLCTADVCLFDLMSEMHGLAAYQRLWERYQHSFFQGLKVFRRDLCIHAGLDTAFISGYSKIDFASAAPDSAIPWSRTTICLQKETNGWKMRHQHISYPFDLHDRQAAFLESYKDE